MEIWERDFSNKNIIEECKNVLHIFGILLITPDSNAKLGRMFSRMLRVKNDWRNRLSCDRLSAILMIYEEGPDIEKFNPYVATSEWYDANIMSSQLPKEEKNMGREILCCRLCCNDTFRPRRSR